MICLHRFSLNIWDVGGQKSLRSYWRNYFETTDGLIWVVDSADRRRLDDCRKELHQLLQEERLLGATLLVFANKQDLPGALSAEEIQNVRKLFLMNTPQHPVVMQKYKGMKNYPPFISIFVRVHARRYSVAHPETETQLSPLFPYIYYAPLQLLDLDSIKTHHWRIVWCSAVTGENLLQGINWLLDDIGARIFTLD